MSPTDFKKQLHALPFVPFRLYVSDGRTFDVRHSEFVTYSKNTLYLYTVTDPAAGELECFAAVGLLHVTGTTPLDALEAVAV